VTGPLTVNDDVTIGGNGFLTVASGGLVEFSSAVNVFNDVTVTGHVYISATPTNPNDATRKDYVDAQVATRLTQTAADARYLQLTGGTLTGTLTATSIGASGTVSGNFVQSTLDLIAGRDVQGRDLIASRDVISTGHVYVGVAPTNANDAARKDYVDAKVLIAFTQTVNGAVPAPTTISGKLLRDDGTWYTLPQATTSVVGITLMADAAAVAAGTTSSSAVSPLSLKDGTRQVIANVAGTAYSVAAIDENKLYAFSSATAVSMTVFTNASVPIPIGYRIDLAQMGAGKVTVVASGGVTITATPSLGLRAQGSVASLIKVATDAWLLTGDLA
jgi:hypothetical protein